MEITNQEKLNSLLNNENTTKDIKGLIELIIEQEDDFSIINDIKFDLKIERFKHLFLNKKEKKYIIETVDDIWKKHIKEHYFKSLQEFKDDTQRSSLLLYNFIEDYEYELFYESGFDKYLFKDENNNELLDCEFTQELLNLVKEI